MDFVWQLTQTPAKKLEALAAQVEKQPVTDEVREAIRGRAAVYTQALLHGSKTFGDLFDYVDTTEMPDTTRIVLEGIIINNGGGAVSPQFSTTLRDYREAQREVQQPKANAASNGRGA